MPIRSRRRKLSKRTKRSKKRSKSVRRQIMDVMSPPIRSMQVQTNSVMCIENAKNYLDLAYWPSETNYAFMSQYHMAAIINQATRMNVPYAVSDEWFFRSCKRSYEFTNISNSVIYINLNEFISKQDTGLLHPAVGISTSGMTGLLSGLLADTNLFPDEGTALTDMLGTSFNTGNSTGYVSTMVYENVFANPLVKECLKGQWKIKIGQEVALRPQQTMLYTQKGIPNYLFAASKHRLAPSSLASDYKGVTKRLVLTMTGQTARATAAGAAPTRGTANYVNAALGVLHITCRDEATVQIRSEYHPVYEVAVSDSTNYLATGRAFEFGDENNAAVANL